MINDFVTIKNESQLKIDRHTLQFCLRYVQSIDGLNVLRTNTRELVLKDLIAGHKDIEGLTELYSKTIFIRADIINTYKPLEISLLLLHELLHSFGLRHCINSKCVMSVHTKKSKERYYWKSIADTKRKKLPFEDLFCNSCRRFIYSAKTVYN